MPDIRAMVNLLLINVSVEDSHTHTAVEGLTHEDFEVFDNGEQGRLSRLFPSGNPRCSETPRRNSVSARDQPLKSRYAN